MDHRHFIIHKPFGYLSQFINNQSKRKNKKLLGALGDSPDGTMAIGRLDEKSEGLLLLTTDGQVSERIRSNKIEKEYLVMLDGVITEDAVEQLRNGVEIRLKSSYHTTLPCDVTLLKSPPQLKEYAVKIRDERHGPTSWISITLREGKFRQIRKMTAAVGYPTLRLIRIRIGNIFLHPLAPGEIKEVDDLML